MAQPGSYRPSAPSRSGIGYMIVSDTVRTQPGVAKRGRDGMGQGSGRVDGPEPFGLDARGESGLEENRGVASVCVCVCACVRVCAESGGIA